MSENLPRPRSAPPTWRLLFTRPADGATNMATDEALMARAARTGEWVMRVYGWSRPTLSLGRNQRAAGLYDQRSLEREGVAVVRRPTGGRALLHDAEVTYSVTAPLHGAGTLQESYGRINRLLLHALRQLGVDATPAATQDGARTIAPDVTPCFDHPGPGELVAAGRKLVGSAQWRDAGALLQHGSILLDGDQRLVAALLTTPVVPPPPPATLRGLLGAAPSLETVADAIFAAVRALECPAASPLDPEDVAEERSARRARHDDPRWIWRR